MTDTKNAGSPTGTGQLPEWGRGGLYEHVKKDK